MSMEIALHRSVAQKKSADSEGPKHIVGFHGFFEDADYIYILLELCRRRVCINARDIISWTTAALSNFYTAKLFDLRATVRVVLQHMQFAQLLRTAGDHY